MKTIGLIPSQELVSLIQDEEGNWLNVPEGQTVVPLVKTATPSLAAGQQARPLLVWFTDRVERQWQVSAAPAPKLVSFRALAFALLEAGLYEQVKAAAQSTTSGEIWWNTAQSAPVRRDHPFVAALAPAVGQTAEQIDAIFAAAAAAQI